jgi:hypothetical protein
MVNVNTNALLEGRTHPYGQYSPILKGESVRSKQLSPFKMSKSKRMKSIYFKGASVGTRAMGKS